MKYEEREYQIACENILLKDVELQGVNPVAAVPTGAGKTKILASFIYKYLEKYPDKNILVLSFTENILQQDHVAISSFFQGINIGLFSKGLKSKTIMKITVAGIQSVYRKPELFDHFDIVIVDEAHAVTTKGNGMYRQFFDKVKCIRVGLTGTPFRKAHGLIYEGEGAMFNKLSFDLCSLEGFNYLVEKGYLTNLISKPANYQMDTTGVKVSAGDYNIKQLSDKLDKDSITKEVVSELVKFGNNYKSWLVFAINIEHADNINNELNRLGIKSEALHSHMNGNRHELTQRFKNREIQAIVSVGMITTGFDAPNIDLIALMRPTKSPVLHVQMLGRGSRVYPGIDHCLILDFAGNLKRLGPINAVEIPKKKGKRKGQPIVKTCPDCGCVYHPTVKVCVACGHEFEFKTKLTKTISNAPAVATKPKYIPPVWKTVDHVLYDIHEKASTGVEMLKVSYKCGIFTVTDYVCYDHIGYAKHLAYHWVRRRWDDSPMPTSTQHLFLQAANLKTPKKILVDNNSKFTKIKEYKF
jgi:DNA repair protein RadD